MNETEPQRTYHSAVHLDNYVIIIGGLKVHKSPSAHVIWMFNLYTEEWIYYAIPKCIIDRGDVPVPFREAVVVAINGIIYTFGGAEYKGYKSQLRNALWTLSKTETGCFTWSFIKFQHDKASPSPRRRHSGWEYAGKLWVYGGHGPSPESYLNDHGDIIGHFFAINNQLLCYDPKVIMWANPQCFGAVPAPQHGHCSTIINHKVFLFGGCDMMGTLHDDVYELTMDSLTWTFIQTAQPRPQARQMYTLTGLTNNKLVLHAGHGSTTLSDTWIMDLTSHSWRQYKSREAPPRRAHTGSLGLNNNVIIIGGYNDGFDYHESYDNVFHVMLEAKSLQQLATRAIYKYQDEIKWICLPKKLISLLGISIRKEKKIHRV